MWEPIVFRPVLPAKWECLEQSGNYQVSFTNYTRWGKKHHNGENERLFVVFNEFNPYSSQNENLGYRYSVRGGNDIKPNGKLRFFNSLKDAEDYMIYLMESTDIWLNEINSSEYIQNYNAKIEFSMNRRRNYVEE